MPSLGRLTLMAVCLFGIESGRQLPVADFRNCHYRPTFQTALFFTLCNTGFFKTLFSLFHCRRGNSKVRGRSGYAVIVVAF